MVSGKMTKFSIVIPSYNQGNFLERALLSIIKQGVDTEIIFIDGGSTDSSVEIIKKYENKIAYWVSEKDKGQSNALNKGFIKATGDIFGWLNSDDVYMRGLLRRCLKRLKTILKRKSFMETGMRLMKMIMLLMSHIPPRSREFHTSAMKGLIQIFSQCSGKGKCMINLENLMKTFIS